MTVLVAVNTRDIIVLAADSQGTITRPLVDPRDLSGFFDMDNGEKMRTDSEGHPLLDTWAHIASHTVELPCKVHYNVEKIFSLEPLNMGVMVSGIASIGDRTVKSLLNEFKTTPDFHMLTINDITLEKTADSLLDFLWLKYKAYYASDSRPDMELMLGGYDKDKQTPGLVRIHVQKNTISKPDYDYCIFFGGTTREIQRMLFGIDAVNKARLVKRNKQLLGKYRNYIKEYLRDKSVDINIPEPEEMGSNFSLFHDLDMDVLQMNCATYSEQDAIECADFLVNTMINSQRFSNQIPSTGGKVQMATISKQAGFQFVIPR